MKYYVPTQVEMVYSKLKGQRKCKFVGKSFFFGLEFSLNLLEYEAKSFIHEKK